MAKLFGACRNGLRKNQKAAGQVSSFQYHRYDDILADNNTGSSKNEDEKPESTTQMPHSSTAASSTTASSGTTSSTAASSGNTSSTTASSGPTSSTTASSDLASLSDFQKKTISNYENNMNTNCSFKKLSELNPNIDKLDEDILYHIALGNKSHDLQKMFKDVKFIIMGGTPKRMEQFAYYIMDEIGYELPPGTLLNDISKHSHRYAMYKVGPIMSVSHGMGMPSIGILLHELIKLVHHAGMVDPIFVRVGTCGGFSQKGGTVVVSDEVVNDYLESVYELSILGANVKFPAALDQGLASELVALANPQDDFETIKGKTYCTDSFYDGSGRADGAICEFSTAEGMEYYQNLKKNGVVNVEMESLAFAALTCRAGIKSAVLAVILSDRLETDQIKQPKEVLDEWKMRPQKLLARYIKKVLAASGISFARTTDVPAGAPTGATNQGTQRPVGTVSTPGVTPSGKIICPALSCGRKPAGVDSTTSQPSAVASTKPTTGRPAEPTSCKSVCEKRSTGMDAGTTGAPTKPASATESVKSTMAAAKADSQAGWRSCYKTCGIGSELVDASTPQSGQQQTTVKPTISSGVKTSAAPSKSFDCACDRGKIAEPGRTPMPPTSTSTIKSCTGAPGAPTSGSTIASTTSGSTTSVPTYKAKDFDSSTKSTDPNDSRDEYYKNCVKYPRCDKSSEGVKRPSGTFETPTQEKAKGSAPTKAGETRPCCTRRSEDTKSPKTQVAEKQKYMEDRQEQELQTTPSSKLPSGGTTRRASKPQPVGNLELGPCCTGNAGKKISKDVGSPQLGPCCTGQKEKESPPECSVTISPDSETFQSTISEESDESPPQSAAPAANKTEDKGREIPTDCPLVLGKKCNTSAYADNGVGALKRVDPSPETPDPREGTKGPVFSTTPMPPFKADSDTPQDQSTTVPAIVTPTAGSRGSCCLKSTSKNGGPATTLSSTTVRQAGGSCCQKFSSAGGLATSTSKPTNSTNGQTKSTAPTSKSGTEAEKEKLVENGQAERSEEKRISGSGSCCIGQKGKGSAPERADSKTYQSTIKEKSNDTSLPQSSSTTAGASADENKKMSTDCVALMKSKCNYKSNTNGRKVSATSKQLDQPVEDSHQGPKASTSTPLPGSKVDTGSRQDQSTRMPAFVTPTSGTQGSCCLKSASKNGGVAATLSSMTPRKPAGPCCHQFSSTGAESANGASKPADSSNCQPKSAAPSSKSAADFNKYDESPSPCAACKKYQDSKIIFTGGTPSVSQPEIIKCPHKLKRLKDECEGYD